jgi:hypothetical protein
MFKRIFAFIFMTILILSVSSVPALAAPYVDGGIKITDKPSTIEAVFFDTEDFLEKGKDAQWAVRDDMADVNGPQTEFGSSGFEGNIGWTAGGEWVQYTINVENAGKYKFEAWLASDATPVGNIEVSYNGTVIGQTESEDKNGWQDYDLYLVGEIEMAAGIGIIKVEFMNGNTNLAAIDVTRLDAPATEAPATEAPAPAAVDTPNDATEAAPADDNAETTAAKANDSENNNMLLWISIAAGAVLVIVVIVVLVTRKKK